VCPLLRLADCFARQGHYVQAVEICTLVARYNGSSLEQQMDAAQRCASFAAGLDSEAYAAAVRRGTEIDFETMLTALMTQLEAH
jgi:hypothetical protein